MKIYVDSRDEMLAIVQGLVERGLRFTVYVDIDSLEGHTYTIQLAGA
jgi:hypothetical protein